MHIRSISASLTTLARVTLLLTLIVSGIAVVGTVGAGPAAAAKKKRAVSRSVSLAVSPSAATGPTQVTLSGAVSKSPRGVAVVLQRYASGAWVTQAITRTTSAAGQYSTAFTSATYGTTTYRAYAPAAKIKRKKLPAAVSPNRTVTVDHVTTVSMAVSDASPVAGDAITFTGTAAPYQPGTAVALQRLINGVWQPDGTSTTLDTTGRYTFTRTPQAGTFTYRAALSRDAAASNAAATSPPVTLDTAGPASLQVQIFHSPTGTTPQVTVTAPDGTTRTITATTSIPNARPGTWTLTGAPLNVDGGKLWPQQPQQQVVIERAQSAALVMDYTVTISDQAAIVPPDAEVEASPTSNPDESTVTITDDSDPVAVPRQSPAARGAPSQARAHARQQSAAGTLSCNSFQRGQYLAVGVSKGFPNGALGTITDQPRCFNDSVTLTLNTAQRPSLNQIAESGSVPAGQQTMFIDGQDVVTTPEEAVSKAIKGTKVTERAKAIRTPVKPNDDAKKIDCGNNTVAVSGKFALQPKITIDPTFSAFQVQSVRVGAGVSQTGQLKLEASGACKTSFGEELWKVRTAPFQVQIGPVPLVVTPQLSLTASGSIDASTTGAITLDQSNYIGGASTWTHDGGVGPLTPDNSVGNFTAAANLTGTVKAQAQVRADLTFLVYGAGGPNLYAQTGLHFDGKATTGTAGSSLKWGLIPYLNAGLSFKIDVFNYAISSNDIEIYRHDFDPIATGGWTTQDDPPTISTHTLPDATAGQPYTARLMTADNRHGQWSVSGGTLPPGLALSGDTITGTSSQPGTTDITVSFNDGSTTASQRLTLVVAPSNSLGGARTARVALTTDDIHASHFSYAPAISSDGRYIAYGSDTANLVKGDTNNRTDVFLYDGVSKQTTRVSVATGGSQANGISNDPAISGDGRYITYDSDAPDLVPGDTNGSSDVFLYDRVTGQTTRVSVATAGTQANFQSNDPSISSDGRYITYDSYASNLVAGDTDTNRVRDIFVYDRVTGQTARVSRAINGTTTDGGSNSPDISGDGNFITYYSYASNLVDSDTNASSDVFLYDRVSGHTTRVSMADGGAQANESSYYPSISGDGQYLTYTSNASNLVAGDDNNFNDVFLFDRVSGQTTRISVTADGAQANNHSGIAAIDRDGRFVTYPSTASNLVAGDTNNCDDVFLFDRVTSRTTRISLTANGEQGNGSSYSPVINGDGRFITYRSSASNLVTGNTGDFNDIFLYDRAAD